MDKDEGIRTQFDDLIANLKSAGGKPVSAWQLSSKIGMPPRNVIEWLLVLEKTGQVQIQNRLGGEYAVWVGPQVSTKPSAPAEPGSQAPESIRASLESQVSPARQQAAATPAQRETPGETHTRHQQELLQMNQELLSMGEQLGRVDEILFKLKEKKKQSRQAELERGKARTNFSENLSALDVHFAKQNASDIGLRADAEYGNSNSRKAAEAESGQESKEDKRVADWISEQEKIEDEKRKRFELEEIAGQGKLDARANELQANAGLERLEAERKGREEATELKRIQDEKNALEGKVQKERLEEEKRRQSELERKAEQERHEAEKRTRRKLEEERGKAALAKEDRLFSAKKAVPFSQSEKEDEEKAFALLEQVEKEISSIHADESDVRTEHTIDFTAEEELGKEGVSMAPKEEIRPIGEPEETSALKIKPLFAGEKQQAKGQRIKKPKQVQVTGTSLLFSEKLSRQVKKIIGQSQELEKLRMEKEKLLGEHYMPMQRRLESEIETISDRVIRMEKNILALHQRASDLPGKVSGVEKLQHTSIKAHSQMQAAFDEASALIEESARQLSEEREKMEMMVEQSRQEISAHRAKSEELEKTLKHISQLEEESENLVVSARAALAEQAERLANAEMHSQELSELKGEIKGSVEAIKREIASTKGVLGGIEKQMGQMRQVEIWAESIKQDYANKMADVGNYIKNGNEEFETLRESVEASFVRRYLHELRQLTDSYSFEFSQARNLEGNLDQRMSEEKKKMEELLEEGRKISYLYETQSREVAGSDKFEQRAETFKSLSELSGQRQMLQQMISEVTGKKSEYAGKPALEIPPLSKGSQSVRIFGSAPRISKAHKAGKHSKAAKKGAKASKAKKGKKR